MPQGSRLKSAEEENEALKAQLKEARKEFERANVSWWGVSFLPRGSYSQKSASTFKDSFVNEDQLERYGVEGYVT